MSTQSANLVLRTFDLVSSFNAGDIDANSNPYQLTPNATGKNGFTTPFSYSGTSPNFVLNNNRTNYTWTNINLRNILGDMYDQYERFVLVLEVVSQGQTYGTDGTGTQLANSSEDLRCMINISGLPFVYNTYNSNTKQVTNVVQLEQLSITKNNTANTLYSMPLQAVFQKKEIADINIFLTRACDNQPLWTGANSLYPHLTFNFQIFGVPNKELDNFIKNTRIPLDTTRVFR